MIYTSLLFCEKFIIYPLVNFEMDEMKPHIFTSMHPHKKYSNPVNLKHCRIFLICLQDYRMLCNIMRRYCWCYFQSKHHETESQFSLLFLHQIKNTECFNTGHGKVIKAVLFIKDHAICRALNNEILFENPYPWGDVYLKLVKTVVCHWFHFQFKWDILFSVSLLIFRNMTRCILLSTYVITTITSTLNRFHRKIEQNFY